MNKQNLNNKIFITLLIIMSSVFLFSMIRNGNYVNVVDNRTSYRFTKPTIKTLLNGEYQDSMDETIADQMPKYKYFKLLYLKIKNYTNALTIKSLKLDKKNKYVYLGEPSLYNGYLVFSLSNLDVYETDITEINKLVDNTNANIYLYYINTDTNYNFETGDTLDDVSYLKERLKVKNIASLDIKDFDEYKDYFYKTDHHWNYKGSYKGFTDIATLMNLNVPEITNEVCFDSSFYGSKKRDLAGINIINETVCMYQFDLPKFKIYISGKEEERYGSSLRELENKNVIAYGDMYGLDYDEIIFINNDSTNDKKLLIYSNSFSNSVNKLLAANYKETYVIDGRHYNGESMVDYINNHNIDDVLILANHILFTCEKNW